MPTISPTIDEVVTVARGHVYAFLAATLADPLQPHFEIALDQARQTVAVAAADLLTAEAPGDLDLAPGEMLPHRLDLTPVARELSKPRKELVREHQELFGLLLGKTAPPYETEYCSSTLTFYRSQELADIAGFYRAFGLEPNREAPERQDHISVELEFMARLIHKELFVASAAEAELREKAAVCREAQAKFLEAHLAGWAPAFAELLRRGAPEGLYAAIADALACFVPAERAILGIRPAEHRAEPRPDSGPVEENQCCGSMPCQ